MPEIFLVDHIVKPTQLRDHGGLIFHILQLGGMGTAGTIADAQLRVRGDNLLQIAGRNRGPRKYQTGVQQSAWQKVQEVDQVSSELGIHGRLRPFCRNDFKADIGIALPMLYFKRLDHLLGNFSGSGGGFRSKGNCKFGPVGDGGHVPAIQRYDAKIDLPAQAEQDTAHCLQRVAPLLVNHIGAMATGKVPELDPHPAGTRSFFPLDRPDKLAVDASRRDHQAGSFQISVHVDIFSSFQVAAVKIQRSVQPCLLGCGEHAFQLRVAQLIVVQYGQHIRDGHSVVRTAGGLLRLQEPVLHHKFQGTLKIKRAVGCFCLDHIHMTLEHDGLMILISGCRRLSDQHVMELVSPVGKAPLFGELHHVVRDPLLMETGAGDLGNLFKKSGVGSAFVVQNIMHRSDTSLSFTVCGVRQTRLQPGLAVHSPPPPSAPAVPDKREDYPVRVRERVCGRKAWRPPV